MARISEGFSQLAESYLFVEIGRKTREYIAENPDKPVIRMGIGDVTRPLAPVVVAAMEKAAREMGAPETFRGYEDSGRGYGFLRESIARYYARRGITLDPDEILISDGAKSDCGNISDLFSRDNTALVVDPVYPVYVDTNLMSGRRVIFADSVEENGFAASPAGAEHADIIYLCSPNNPTGTVYTKAQLREWVDYALAHQAVIIFDAAYEAFITDEALPHSIYEVEGAEKCAIEICSLSKTAGFTGTRCGYTIVPRALVLTENGEDVSLLKLWSRRQSTKFNGVSYPVQRAAEAVFTEEGQRQIGENLAYYRENAKMMTAVFDRLGIKYTGGQNSPYIWFKCPDGMTSWGFFDRMLEEIQVVGTPGSGFGKNGEGWFRLTAFGTHENTLEAMKRFEALMKRKP